MGKASINVGVLSQDLRTSCKLTIEESFHRLLETASSKGLEPTSYYDDEDDFSAGFRCGAAPRFSSAT